MAEAPPRRVMIVVETATLDHGRSLPTAVQELRKRGIATWAATVGPEGPLHAALPAPSGEHLALGARNAKGYLRAAWELARVMKERRIDVVHGSESISGFVGAVAARLAGTPACIFHRHHVRPEGSWLLRQLAVVAGRLSDATMAVSKSVAEAAIADGVPTDQVVTAWNGIPEPATPDPGVVASLRRNLDIGDDEPVLVFVGRLRQVKGVEYAVHALPLVQAQVGRRTHLVIVGDGPERESLAHLARELDPESQNIHMVGFQDRVAEWYALADAVLMPSLMEPFGLVAAEAMAAARPLVASNVDGLRFVVEDGTSGILVPPGDVEALADAAARILSDPQLALRLGRAASQRQRDQFTVEAMVDRWVECYRSLALSVR